MADKRLEGKKIAFVIAPEQFRDEELFTPRARVEEEGAAAVVASTSKGTASGMLGGSCQVETLINELEPAQFDAVVVVGGMGSPEHLWDNEELHHLLKALDKDGKIIASICLSGGALARAGVLKGKEATVWECEDSLEALKKGEARYVKKPVVKDGRVITANGPEAAEEFASTVIAELAKVTV